MVVTLLTNALVLLAVEVALVVNETYSQRKAAQAQLISAWLTSSALMSLPRWFLNDPAAA